MTIKILFLIMILKCSSAKHVNESEYERMPPLFGLDPTYDKCLKQVDGVYCVAKFDLVADSQNELMNTIREYTKHDIKYYNHSYIDRGICITQSCKKFTQNRNIDETADLKEVLERCLNETIWSMYALEAKLSEIYSCDKHNNQKSTDVGDWFLAIILLFLLTMNVIGSFYDVCYVHNIEESKNKVGNPYLLCFSIFQNWSQFSKIDVDPQFQKVIGMHGLKSIISLFVASSHIMWLVGSYTDNPREFEVAHSRIHYQLIFSGMVIVQVFFVISGCLLVFNLQIMSEKHHLSWKVLPKLLMLRWSRLTPGNTIMIIFTATWLRHLGSGPLWQMSVGRVANDCRNHWWQHLLYFNNYLKGDKACAIQTWHVATEMQLFTVGLVVYIATISRGRCLAISALGLMGVIGPALHVWVQDLDALVLHRPEFYRTFDGETYRSLHVLGHNNLSCYAIGMATGFVSYYCVKNKIEYTNCKFLKYLTWCSPLAAILLILSGSLFYTDGHRPHVLIRMAYAATQRAAMGVITALLVLNLVFKFENVIRGVLNWRGWIWTSRLTYTVYLLHVNIVHVLFGSRTQLGHVSFFHVIVYHFGVVSLTFLISVPFHILLERPIRSLVDSFVVNLSTNTKEPIHLINNKISKGIEKKREATKRQKKYQ